MNDAFRYLNIGLPEDILRLKMVGEFEAAIRLIDRRLSEENLHESMKNCLTAHREIMVRMPDFFPYSYEQALAIILEHIPDFTKDEFDDYIARGAVRWIFVNRQMRIIESFFDTLTKTDPAFAARADSHLPGVESSVKGSTGANVLDRAMAIIKEKGQLSNRIRVRASVRVKDEYFTPGMFVRVHIPIPAACDRQSDIVIEKYFPENGKIAPEDAPQRTICFEENMSENHEFWVEYSYVHTAVYNDTKNMVAVELQPVSYQDRKSFDSCMDMQPPSSFVNGQSFDSPVDAQSFDFYTREEQPHIEFTPYIKELVATLSEGTTNPLEKARKFYDYITLNMKYTFMPDYFVLDSIADSCARNKTGDCGVFALLFITMCRCAGIPARWQSGLAVEPDFIGAHDWAQFYIAPHGWLYADPSFGIGAVRAENEERRQFYFGNLDAYRMVANHAFQAPFTIDKKFWRYDPYDNQVGEMETDQRGLRYDEFVATQETLVLEEI